MEPGVSAEADPAGRVVKRLRAVLGSATLIMLTLSWPLWTAPEAAFPRVPFLRLAAWPETPALVSWGLFSALLTTIALAAFLEKGWRLALGLSLALLGAFVLGDQHRFQPWVYQYLVIGIVLASLAPSRAIPYARWWFAGLYFYSGLSKLDVSFMNEMGAVFLAALVRPVGLDPTGWGQVGRVRAILAMPAAELVVAGLLLGPRTRRVGLAGALVLHSALLVILGPWGLGHSTIVLVWNGAMMAEVCLLFGPNVALQPELTETAERGTWFALVVKGLFWAALVLPLGERWGWLDAWPSHALYASHVERTAVFLNEEDLNDYPPDLRRHLRIEGDGPWHRLDLTGWSREVRGVPVYPSGRVCNGLAEALASRYGGSHQVRVIQWGLADRWTGERKAAEALGLAAIRRQGSLYRLNAHPVRRPGRFGIERSGKSRTLTPIN